MYNLAVNKKFDLILEVDMKKMPLVKMIQLLPLLVTKFFHF